MGVQTGTFSTTCLAELGLWDAEGCPPWGRPLPRKSSPFQGLQSSEVGALLFLETQQTWGLWGPIFGVPRLPLCFGVGFRHFPVPWDRAGLAREDGLLQFWVALAEERQDREHRTWRKGQQLVQPWRWGFQTA